MVRRYSPVPMDERKNDTKARRPHVVPADETGVECAAAALIRGEPVALPTETVYGLAADARSAAAVAAIYAAKGRPDFNPLIVHIPDMESARTIAHFDMRAQLLADAFWPGPMTLVLPQRRQSQLASAVTAGLETVAIRMPAHPVMRAVLAASGLALAAPSANRSGGISPSRAEHVALSLDGCIDLILDGGPCEKGLESTIVAVRQTGWDILRPGPVTADMIEAVLGNSKSGGTDGEPATIEAPGQLSSHYAPSKPLRLDVVVPENDEWFIGFGDIGGDDSLSDTADLEQAAQRLYECLHRADRSDKARISVAPVPRSGIGIAVSDRLKRAAAPRL